MKFKINNNDGIAFIMIILLLALVGSLATAMLIMNSSNINLASDATARSKAFYAAEGGANYLNININKNTKGKNITSQSVMEDEIRNLTGDLTNELEDPIFEYSLEDNLKINNFDINFSYDDEKSNPNEGKYAFIIKANNNEISESIRLVYEIKTLPPFFRSSRQANKINITNSSFGSWWGGGSENFPAHSFATAEKYYYDKWEEGITYKKGDIIYYKGNHYSAKKNHISDRGGWFSSGNAPGSSGSEWDRKKLDIEEPDLRRYDELNNAVDYGMDVLPPLPPKERWNFGDDYSEDDKVSNIIDDEEKYYISDVDNPKTEPGVDNGWKNEWQEYYNYKKEVVEVFGGLINDNDGKVYSDPEYDYIYNSSESYNIGDIVLKDKKIQERKKYEDSSKEYWDIVDSDPEFAYEKFLKDNSYNVGPYIKIEGDFTPTQVLDKSFRNMKTDDNGIVHILIDGNINMEGSNINFKGNKNVIMYVNGDLNFNPGFINIGGFGGQLAYFAPNATFTFKDQNGIGFGSSMVVNELNIINSRIDEVSYDTEESPLIGKMNPKVAELSRSLAAQHSGVVSKINPIRQSWEQIK